MTGLILSPIALSLRCASIIDGHYRYTRDLLALAACIPPGPALRWPRYHSPIRLDLLQPYLDAHPDRSYAAYISDGLRNGFRVGFHYGSQHLKSVNRNHPSCLDKPSTVNERIQAELAAGRLLGPIDPAHLTPVHVSPMGLVPKPHQKDKFRLIVDLSSPATRSVNDGIPSNLCSLQYASIDEAVAIVSLLGRGTMLVKIDLKDAYRIVPVHPDDYHLLGIHWNKHTYLDRALPFGLRSAPKIFTAVADFIAWALHQHGIAHQLHYFLFLGTPLTDEAQRALDTVTQVLRMLGIPIAIHKTEGPDTMLVFLGIIIDTINFELRLPEEKLARLNILLQDWCQKKRCRKHELESLVGHLSHAATVVRHGRTFLRQLFALLSRARSNHHFVYLDAGARANILWWKVILRHWNGRSFFPGKPPSITVTSDASGTFGCGAFSVQRGWFELAWPSIWDTIHIAAKELVPIVIAMALWGGSWLGQCVCFETDNMAVVEVLRTRTACDPLLMHLLRCLTWYAAVYHVEFVARHVAGVLNIAADALSRDNATLFSSMFPQVSQVSIPKPVLDLLVEERPDWGSRWCSGVGRCLILGGPNFFGYIYMYT